MLRFLIAPAAVLLLASCQEVGPSIDFGPAASDTSYTATVEAPQQRVVLIEEFTGVTCPQCPDGHEDLKSILASNAGRVAIVGIQPNNVAQARPYNKEGIETKHDNRTGSGTEIGSNIYGGIVGLPMAGIDRIADLGKVSYLYLRTDWSGKVDIRKALPTKANVSIANIYNSSSRDLAVTVKVAYTEAVSLDQKLTVVITEDKVIDVQELATSEKYIKDYEHEHVFRSALTLSTGAQILSGMKPIQPGQVYQRTFRVAIPEGWNPDNCHVVAFVANADPANQEVLQAAEKAVR